MAATPLSSLLLSSKEDAYREVAFSHNSHLRLYHISHLRGLITQHLCSLIIEILAGQ